MATSRSWRQQTVYGPQRARLDDIGELNHVFSDSFTERYRRDGMVGVRVPFRYPTIWRYAIEDAAEGALVWRYPIGATAEDDPFWRDDRGKVVAWKMVHRSGIEGWMGRSPVRTRPQGA